MTDPKKSPARVSRRTLLGSGAAATLSAAGYRRVLGANERVGIGFIGFGLIGKRHVLDFQRSAGRQTPRPWPRSTTAGAMRPPHCWGRIRASSGDFRKLLDDRDVDAVVVSTPDHWHALMAMLACAAGKDVYVEKPLSLFVREGRWMIDVARRHKRVVQVGTQQRSGPHYSKARELIREGHIGKVVAVRMWYYRNVMPGFGRPRDCDPPAGTRLRQLARTGAQAAVQPEPLALSLPMVLGLLRRTDDKSGTALARHGPLVSRCSVAPVGDERRAVGFALCGQR